MKTFTFFGREPALWLALFSSAIMAFSAFVLPLSVEEQGTLNASCTALFGLLTAWSVASDGLQAAILGFIKSILALAISFGLMLAPDNQAIVMTLASAVTAMFIRQTAIAPVSPDNSVRNHQELKQISMKKQMLHAFIAGFAILSLGTATLSLTSCAAVGGGAIASTIIGQVEAWALPIADQWIQNWIHSHLGATKSAVAASTSLEDQFVADNKAKAQKAYPQASSKDIEAGLRSAYQKSAAK